MYGHAAAVLRAMGRCVGDPACTTPPSVEDDADSALRRCPRHALDHLRRLTSPEKC